MALKLQRLISYCKLFTCCRGKRIHGKVALFKFSYVVNVVYHASYIHARGERRLWRGVWLIRRVTDDPDEPKDYYSFSSTTVQTLTSHIRQWSQ